MADPAARAAAWAMIVTSASACAPASHVLTGSPRPATSPAGVAVYSAPPPAFEEIARLTAHRKTLFNGGGEHSTDKVVARLKAEAARLGANGLIVEGFEQKQSLSIGGAAGGESYSAHGTVSLGLGAFFGVYDTSGTGRAIYVPPDP